MASKAAIQKMFAESGFDNLLRIIGEHEIMARMQLADGIMPQPWKREEIGATYAQLIATLCEEDFPYDDFAQLRMLLKHPIVVKFLEIESRHADRIERFFRWHMRTLGTLPENTMPVAAE